MTGDGALIEAPEIRISAVDAAEVHAQLPEPIRFGEWVMEHRSFAVVRLESTDGLRGYGFTLTRDGPLAATIRTSVRPHYLDRDASDPVALAKGARRANLSTLSSGLGLRALSIVDVAAWDLIGKTVGTSVISLLGGSPVPIPATAIIGYPPSIGPSQINAQVSRLYAEGWRRFKMPVASNVPATYDRLEAAVDAAPDGNFSLDGAWTFNSVEDAAEFCGGLPVQIDWFEDMFPPGDSRPVAELRERVSVRIAMGDEQGGAYYPDALIQRSAVDVVRIDATCMGGPSSFLELVEQARHAGLDFAPHMNAHIHYRLLAGLGISHVPVEWGIPGTGVDPFADSLEQPRIEDGLMLPLDDESGFGNLVNKEWLQQQPVDDPDGLIEELEVAGRP